MNYKSLYKTANTHVVDGLKQTSEFLFAGITQIITEKGRKIVTGRYFTQIIEQQDQEGEMVDVVVGEKVVRTFTPRIFTDAEAEAMYQSLNIQSSNHFDQEQELYNKALLAIILQEQILGLTQASDWQLIQE